MAPWRVLAVLNMSGVTFTGVVCATAVCGEEEGQRMGRGEGVKNVLVMMGLINDS